MADDNDQQLCSICRRRPIGDDGTHTCTSCPARIRNQLDQLDQQVARLHRCLLPGPAPAGEKVRTSQSAPTPARLDVLLLVGPGTGHAKPTTVPLVRRWTTREPAEVTVIRDGQPVTETRLVTTWHRALEHDPHGQPVMTDAGDQTGVIPPAEWARMWAGRWRRQLGHHQPHPTHAPGAGRSRDDRHSSWPSAKRVAAGWRTAATHPVGQLLAAWLLVVRRELARQRSIRLGIAARQAPGRRPDDPTTQEWEDRYGPPTVPRAVKRDVAYLTTWLDHACRHDGFQLPELAAELRALSAELERALGETPDRQWLGRCPAELTDRSTGETFHCGAGLWQDPHVSEVACPRCRSTWREREWLRLALLIRDVWPLDPRRRYTDSEAEHLPPVGCEQCGTPVQVEWREATEPRETRRWWRPGKVTCPQGCEAIPRWGSPLPSAA